MRNLPVVTKNLLLANVIVWLLDALLQRSGIHLVEWFGLMNWSFSSFANSYGSFHLWQPVTYMFMHANFGHLFCNMFAVLMFGPALEHEWGERRYLIYYFVCGIGAALVQELVWMTFLPGQVAATIGASGAVFGILLAFGWLFPDTPLYLLFIPVPIRARIMVIVYAVIELFAGLASFSGDNVAHFAHLGGMLFGLLLILWWQNGWDKWFRRNRIHRVSEECEKGERDFSGYHYHPSEK
ncbi:MAG: rhomboid family intramembrane serine protease [Paludibacteraceae bacterium]|nr:rhomboid family intramembrane serine protease [Paludibacteraceae bacterium]